MLTPSFFAIYKCLHKAIFGMLSAILWFLTGKNKERKNFYENKFIIIL